MKRYLNNGLKNGRHKNITTFHILQVGSLINFYGKKNETFTSVRSTLILCTIGSVKSVKIINNM